MALIITPTTEKKIYIQGTTIELASVYNRLEFSCRANGVSMEVAFSVYVDHSEYNLRNSVPTDLPIQNLVQDIDPLTQVQGLEAAHELAKAWYESLGYIVAIDLA